MSVTDLLGFLPKTVQIAVASLVIGGGAIFGAESRYMTVADFTKSYILDLKREIRTLENELRDSTLTARERQRLNEQLQALLDELCYELPNDPYCKG